MDTIIKGKFAPPALGLTALDLLEDASPEDVFIEVLLCDETHLWMVCGDSVENSAIICITDTEDIITSQDAKSSNARFILTEAKATMTIEFPIE